MWLLAYTEAKGSGCSEMAVVKATSADVKILARLLRAEAEGEGDLGMLMVGNVGIKSNPWKLH
ncbi:spore germination cell wall hydrolase CwlJ-like protein [Paenibacillus baekrokdamisoli]|nr:spore germination cell wall hydrolase CwlJ-like protein [Paenibacillus baekrokdamisoli]